MKPCPLCEYKASKIAYPAPKNAPVSPKSRLANGSMLRSFDVVRCAQCHFHYLNNPVSEETLTGLYKDQNNHFYLSQEKLRLRTFERYFKKIRQYVPKGSILDIGCAGGLLLSIAKSEGWEVYGTEPNDYFRSSAKEKFGLFLSPSLEDLQQGFQANVVTLFDVLEHVINPRRLIQASFQRCKKKGFLFINIPNFDSLSSRLFRHHWWCLCDSHLSYFGTADLIRLLQEEGFVFIKKYPYMQSLELGYLAQRLKERMPVTGHFIMRSFERFGLSKLPIHYVAGQTFFVFQKNEILAGGNIFPSRATAQLTRAKENIPPLPFYL